MRSIWDNSWFSIPYLIFLAGGLLFTYWYPLGYELIALNALRVEPLNTFFIYYTKMGEPRIWLLLALILAIYQRRNALLLLLAACMMAPVSWVLKHQIGVPRPVAWLDMQQLQDAVVKVPGVRLLSGFNSMPSGHTMMAFAMFSLLTLMLPRKYWMLGLIFLWSALLVAFSRVFLVQHFLRDVLAGSVFGLLISDFVWQLYRRFFPTRLERW